MGRELEWKGDWEGAVERYRELCEAESPGVRAHAHARLARCLLETCKPRETDEADDCIAVAERLSAELADPARVARAVPGLQQDAGAEPVTGRLKMRIGGHTITYRGAVRVVVRDDGAYAVTGDATEARGSGSVKLAAVYGAWPVFCAVIV